MKSSIAILIASVYGVVLRLTFGMLNEFLEIMSISFLLLSPVIIGFLTVVLIPRKYVNSMAKAILYPLITSALILLITLFSAIEGIICWIMVFPLFALFAGLGGMTAYTLTRRKKPNNSKLKVSLVILIPAFCGLIEQDNTLVFKELTITKEIVIHSSPENIWQQLTQTEVKPESSDNAMLANWMGFPRHKSTTIDTLALGGLRLATYEKGLYFKEYISEIIPNKKLVLDIKTEPENIPPNVMDEHIIIGGKYLDLIKDIYLIEPLGENKSKVSLTSTFVINTPFNWYAELWSDLLMSDILKAQLQLVAKQSEAET